MLTVLGLCVVLFVCVVAILGTDCPCLLCSTVCKYEMSCILAVGADEILKYLLGFVNIFKDADGDRWITTKFPLK
jgi:hypothetical protein